MIYEVINYDFEDRSEYAETFIRIVSTNILKINYNSKNISLDTKINE